MKNITLALIASLFFASCSLQTEKNKNPTESSDEFITNYLKGNYDAIYEDGSIEMKAHVPKELFLNIADLQEKIYGKMEDASLKNETSGKYNSSTTNVYHYTLKNGKGEVFNLTAEFLKGHLLKNHIDESPWGNESDFAKGLVTPVAALIMETNYQEIHELLDKKYPIDQVQSLIQTISETCNGSPSKYESSWTDSDENNKMMVAFVYGYEGKGYLEYRFYVEESDYPLAGIFFTPDTETKLP